MVLRVALLVASVTLAVSGSDCGGRPTPRPRTALGPASPVTFQLDNRLERPVFVDLSTAPVRLWRLEASGSTALETGTFCRSPQHDDGPCLVAGSDYHCGVPAMRTLAIPSGAVGELEWSGKLFPKVPDCPSQYLELAASKGRYRVELCGTHDTMPASPAPSEPGELGSASPSGKPVCATAEFDLPASGPVRVRFGAGRRTTLLEPVAGGDGKDTKAKCHAKSAAALTALPPPFRPQST